MTKRGFLILFLLVAACGAPVVFDVEPLAVEATACGPVTCSAGLLCDRSYDCVEPCRDSCGKLVHVAQPAPGETCESIGLFSPLDLHHRCILPCFFQECVDSGGVACTVRDSSQQHRFNALLLPGEQIHDPTP